MSDNKTQNAEPDSSGTSEQSTGRRRKSETRRPDLNTIYTINPDGSRNFLQLADVKGRWHTLRHWVYGVLLAIFVATPWLSAGGHPLVHFDIPGRRAYLMGSTFTNQDFHLMFFILIGMGLGLFVITSLFGRVWCGFACPQTLFMEGLFRPIERLVEGSRQARQRRERSGEAGSHVGRKLLKHALFIVTAWVVQAMFLAYFMPVREILELAPFFPGHQTALIWTLFWTALLYFNYSWFREQTCLIICPYGRLQSTLVDYDTLIIGYDEKRGEPRHKGAGQGGDCVDCMKCIDVCPTGIDIRNGLQMECIGCTNCIDACDTVMTKLGKPKGLIRFDSSRGFETGVRRILRPRFLVYVVVLAGLAGLFIQRAGDRQDFHVTSTRSRGLPFTLENDAIRNLYTLHLQNKTTEPQVYTIAPADDALADHADVSYIIPQSRVKLAGMADANLTLFAIMPRASYTEPKHFNFVVTDSTSGVAQTLQVRFRGP